MKKRRFVIISLAVLLGCYVAGPYLAGAFRVGDRLGPVVYPMAFHQSLYILAHEGSHNEKPRVPLDSWMYNRPVFYGLPRRLKSLPERQAYIASAQANSNRLHRLIEMNQEFENANKAAP